MNHLPSNPGSPEPQRWSELYQRVMGITLSEAEEEAIARRLTGFFDLLNTWQNEEEE
jgi:hypothetical protein